MDKILLVYEDGSVESMHFGYDIENFIRSIGGRGLVLVINTGTESYFKINSVRTWTHIPDFMEGSILIPVNSALMEEKFPNDVVRIS